MEKQFELFKNNEVTNYKVEIKIILKYNFYFFKSIKPNSIVIKFEF